MSNHFNDDNTIVINKKEKSKRGIDKSRKVSRGERISSAKTGKLSFCVDKKQLRLVKPQMWMVSEYVKAERQREHLLQTRGPTHTVQVKRKNGSVERIQASIPTVHSLTMRT